MSSHQTNPPALPTAPSWFWPVTVGAVVSFLLHLPVLEENFLWYPCCCGFTGGPLALVPVLLALRNEPLMGAQAGFAVAFLSVGIGVVAVAAITVTSGFEIGPESQNQIRDAWLESGVTPEEVDETLAMASEAGPILSVVAAGVVALTAGVTGAVLASWYGRRYRRKPPGPTSGFPPAAQI